MSFVQEWGAVGFSEPVAWFVFVPIIAMLSLRIQNESPDPELPLVITFTVLALLQARHAPFLALAAAAMLARSIETALPPTDRVRFSRVLLVPIVFVAAILAAPETHSEPLAPAPWEHAASFGLLEKLHGNAFVPYPWAAYLVYRGLQVRVLIDTHGDPFSKSSWDDYLALANLSAGWRSALDRNGINLVFVDLNTPLAQALLLDRNWRLRSSSMGILIFQR